MWRRMMPRSSSCASTPDTEQRVGRLINGRRGPAPRGSQAPSMPSRRAIDSATVPAASQQSRGDGEVILRT